MPDQLSHNQLIDLLFIIQIVLDNGLPHVVEFDEKGFDIL
jgi:hypothetical protein